MPKARRAENKGLPKRWQFAHGAFYYRVPPGLEHLWDGRKRFRLGGNVAEAYKVWAERIGHADPAKTVGAMLDRYTLEVVGATGNPKSKAAKLLHIASLRRVFQGVPVAGFKPAYVYKYVTARSRKKQGEDGKVRGGKVAAHREIETLSHAFTKMVEWGEIDRHPFLGQVRLEGEPSRTRYVEDWELQEMLALDSKRKKGSVAMIQAYLRLKLLTGLARSDLLRLRAGEHLRGDGIHVTRHKTAGSTGKSTIYEYATVPERREAVEQAKAVRPALSPFLFCKRDGQGYIDEATGECHGWDSMWQRFVDRVLRETNVKERFTEHDLRAKVGSDAESLEKARALLQHADARTTQRIYRRKPERV